MRRWSRRSLGTAALAGAAVLGAVLLALAPSSWPRVAVFLLATFALVRILRREGPLSPERGVRAVFFLLILIGLLAPAAVGMILSAAAVLHELTHGAATARGDLLATAAVLAALVWWARRWPARAGEVWFLVLTAAVAVGLKLAYVAAVQMPPISDFQEMWTLSSRIATEGWSAVPRLPGFENRIYLERILPYLLPLRLLFGAEPTSYGVANVLAGALASLLVYLLTRSWFGPAAARAAFVVSLFAAETWMASEIPTHDIPGTLFTLAGLALVPWIVRRLADGRWRAALGAGALLGLAAVVIQLQRTTGPFFLISCGLFGTAAALLGGRRLTAGLVAGALAALLLVPAGVYKVAQAGLVAAGLRVPPEVFARRRGMVMTAGSESWGDGDWGHLHYDYYVRYSSVQLDWYRLGALRLVSDTHYTPLARLTGYLRKSRVLFDLGVQTVFYVAGAEVRGLGKVDSPTELRVLFVSRCFAVFFLFCFMLGAMRLWWGPPPPLLSLLPLFYLSVISALLIFFALVQPRYVYQIWYVGAIYAGLWLARGQDPPLAT